VVSVLFPSRAAGGNCTGDMGEGAEACGPGLDRSVEQLYVVMLAPQSSYVTYRCDLPYLVEMKS
jgi:hypothetical protein